MVTNELTFCTVVEETKSDNPEPLREAVLMEELAMALGTAPQAQTEDVTENWRRDAERRPE